MLAVVVAAMLQASSPEIAVSFNQDDARWPVVVRANGVVSLERDSLVLRLRGIDVADQPANPNTIPYSSYRVCLARQSGESYETAGCSQSVKIKTLVPESERATSLSAQKLTIPSTGAASLEGHWLVLEMESRPVQGKTYDVPSHSQHSLFGTIGSM